MITKQFWLGSTRQMGILVIQPLQLYKVGVQFIRWSFKILKNFFIDPFVKMRIFFTFCSLLMVLGGCKALPSPFLWPSSFRGTTTTTTTTTTHAGPPHPHAQNNHGTGTTPVIGHSQSSHLHARPAITSSYLTNRPLPPLVGAHHHHNHRPVASSPTSHLHLHGGSISGPSTNGYNTGHRHHYHVHHQPQNPHHHHLHSSARVLHSHVHPAALHFPLSHF